MKANTAKVILEEEMEKIFLAKNELHRKKTQCKGKIKHKDVNSALMAQSVLLIRWNLKQEDILVYKCPHCKKFHVGGKVKQNATKKKIK